MKISFCLITLNEEHNLPRCLGSLKDLADEIVIIDSGSTDGTEAVAKQFGARFIHQEWLGYVGQKNRAIREGKSEWTFSIDADEVLSPQLRDEIQSLKYEEAPSEVTGYSMPRCVSYEERWIRHGDWYPDRHVRLFRKKSGRFVGGRVHERLEVEGPIEALEGDLYHYSFKDAADHWSRCEKYAKLWAETQFENGRKIGPLTPPARAMFRWFRGYILKHGFLDGSLGLRIANYCAGEVYLKYKLLRRMNRVKA
jgi:glycosyltransferase involved in cell wall biosynthesis